MPFSFSLSQVSQVLTKENWMKLVLGLNIPPVNPIDTLQRRPGFEV
jgi:hypothetical protein